MSGPCGCLSLADAMFKSRASREQVAAKVCPAAFERLNTEASNLSRQPVRDRSVLYIGGNLVVYLDEDKHLSPEFMLR